jgi:hypothetical protein
MFYFLDYWSLSATNKFVIILTIFIVLVTISSCLLVKRLYDLNHNRGFAVDTNNNYIYWNPKKLPLNLKFTRDVDPIIVETMGVVVDELNSLTNKVLIHPFFTPYEITDPLRIDILLVNAENDEDFKKIATKNEKTKTIGATIYKTNNETGEVYYTKLMFLNNFNEEVLKKLIRHELGHILCLGHDSEEKSTMHWRVDSLSPKAFSKSFIKKLNKRYK